MPHHRQLFVPITQSNRRNIPVAKRCKANLKYQKQRLSDTPVLLMLLLFFQVFFLLLLLLL
jgi:predicted nucleic acid-binding Zn ribbon protein